MAGTLAWWTAHLAWLVVPGVLLLGIVAVVGRAEQVRPPRLTRPGPATAAAAAAAVVLIGIGFIDLAGSTALALLEPGSGRGRSRRARPWG